MKYQYKSKSTANRKDIEDKLADYIETLEKNNQHDYAVFYLGGDNESWNSRVHATFGQIGELLLNYAVTVPEFKKVIIAIADVMKKHEN